jgi:hypothetical protein
MKSTRFFILFRKTIDLPSPRILEFFVFNTDVSVSKSKLKPEKCAQYASTITEIKPNPLPKKKKI